MEDAVGGDLTGVVWVHVLIHGCHVAEEVGVVGFGAGVRYQEVLGDACSLALIGVVSLSLGNFVVSAEILLSRYLLVLLVCGQS